MKNEYFIYLFNACSHYINAMKISLKYNTKF